MLLKRGSKGEEVKLLQEKLGNLDVDGIFGRKTEAAVKAFQAANDLKVDGIVGAQTWGALNGDPAIVIKHDFVKPVDYKQYDSKWAKVMYSNHGDKAQTIKSSGCGPTSMADIVATLIDSKVTPVTLAEKSLAWGCRSYNSGTNWDFFQKVANEYGFRKYVKTTSLETLKACLDSGGYAVASMGKGYWTSGGHYICIWKYDSTYIYANDPASSKRKKQNQTDFMKQRKAFFCFWK